MDCEFSILAVKAGFSAKALAELNYDVRGVDIADHWNTFNRAATGLTLVVRKKS